MIGSAFNADWNFWRKILFLQDILETELFTKAHKAGIFFHLARLTQDVSFSTCTWWNTPSPCPWGLFACFQSQRQKKKKKNINWVIQRHSLNLYGNNTGRNKWCFSGMRKLKEKLYSDAHKGIKWYSYYILCGFLSWRNYRVVIAILPGFNTVSGTGGVW